MDTDVLKYFRDTIAREEFSLAEWAEESGIPSTTLAYMRKEEWGTGLTEKVEKLAAARERLEAKRAAKPTAQGRQTTAA